MIDLALGFIRESLNHTLKQSLPGLKDPVLSGVAAPDGAILHEIEDRIAITLVNVQTVSALASGSRFSPGSGKSPGRLSPALNLDLYLLVSAQFRDYPTSLKCLSMVLEIINNHPVHTRQSAPELPPAVESLSLELMSLNLNELSSVWTTLGAKYRPSVIYKARLISNPEEGRRLPALSRG